MDCEKFDQHAMDALYDELDELTYAAMKRHMEGCGRCASAFAGLRATRDVGVLPLEEPSEELEARILEAVAVAQKKTPFRRKALRALAWAGSHAMRPQLAMAALFVLVIGSSLLLLRAKPGTVGVAPVRVTERGVPAPDQPEPVAVMPSPPAAAAPVAAVEGAEAKRADDASRPEKEKAERAAGEGDASAAFKEAQALQKKSGCAAALGKLDEIGAQYPGTQTAHTAMWEAARCYKADGDDAKARELLLSLRSVSGFRDRAERELASLDENAAAQRAQALGGGVGKAAAAAPARIKATATPQPADAADEARPTSPAQRAAPAPAQRAAPAGDGNAAPDRALDQSL